MHGFETQLKAGWFFHWSGEVYQIQQFDAACLRLDVVHVATQTALEFSLPELVLSSEAEQLLFAPTLHALQTDLERHAATQVWDEGSVPEDLLDRADRIIRTVEQVEQQVAEAAHQAQVQGEAFQRTPALREVLGQADLQLSLSRYYDYRKLVQEHQGNRASLAAALRRSTFNQLRIGPAERHLLDTLILRYYARNRPLRPQTLYRLAQSVLARTEGQWLDPTRQPELPVGLIDALLNPHLPMTAVRQNPDIAAGLVPVALPSRSWFYQYLRWFERQPDAGKAVVTARYGQARWEQEHQTFDTFVTRAAAPLQYVFADHWLLDVFTVDEATRRQVNRLWFTALIDAYSRSILGTALLCELPCIESIQSALCHAIWPKHQYGQFNEQWVCYGIPQQLSLDNAWAHHSHSLEDLARGISAGGRYTSIDLAFRPPYRGRYGALIERFFGNLSAQVKEHLPGALNGSTPADRRVAAQSACLLYEDLDQFLTDVVVTYQHTPHRELAGMTPHEKWLSGWQHSAPLVPPYTPAMERLFWRMSPATRQLTREGLHAFGLTYTSVELERAPCVEHDGQPVNYSFRYDPHDISRLAVFRDGAWLGDGYARELRLPDGTVRTLSLAERELAKTVARQAHTPVRDWLRFIDNLDTLSTQRQREKRRALSPGSTARSTNTVSHPVTTDEDALLDAFLKD
jgi:hypothetical protein